MAKRMRKVSKRKVSKRRTHRRRNNKVKSYKRNTIRRREIMGGWGDGKTTTTVVPIYKPSSRTLDISTPAEKGSEAQGDTFTDLYNKVDELGLPGVTRDNSYYYGDKWCFATWEGSQYKLIDGSENVRKKLYRSWPGFNKTLHILFKNKNDKWNTGGRRVVDKEGDSAEWVGKNESYVKIQKATDRHEKQLLTHALRDIYKSEDLYQSNVTYSEYLKLSVNKALNMIANNNNKKDTFYYSNRGDQSGHDKYSITPIDYLKLQLKADIFDKPTSENVLNIIAKL